MKDAPHQRGHRRLKFAPQLASVSRPTFSVIVPAHNAAHQLPLCLQALAASKFRDLEVIVVDDASRDRSHRIALTYGARCIRSRNQVGPAAARNLGARSARGTLLVFVDADVIVPENALELFAEDFETNVAVAAVFGSYDDEPVERNFLSQYKNLLHHYVHQQSRPEATTFWSGCGAIRKSRFEQIGGFDEGLYRKPSIEDIELGSRLCQAGYEIRLDKRIQARHLKRWTPLQLLRTDIRDRAVPWSRLILRARSMPSDLNLTYGARASVVLALSLAFCVAWSLVAAALHRDSSQLSLMASLPASATLLVLNQRLYRFFLRKRGLGFALRVIPTHWAYFFYSGLAWIFCCLEHLLSAFEAGRRGQQERFVSRVPADWIEGPQPAIDVGSIARVGNLPTH